MKNYTGLGANTDKEKDKDSDGDFDFNNVLNKHAVESRRIFFWHELEDADALSIVSQLHYLRSQNKQPIQIVINSPGGSVDAMYSILDEMKSLQEDGVIVSTLTSGVAYSAAAVILAMGSKGYRYARPNANIMLHPMSYGLGHDYSDYQEKLTAFYKKVNLKMNKTLMEALGIKGEKQYKKFLLDMDKGLWLTAEEAKTRGVIDEVWSKPLGALHHKGK